MIVSNAQSKLPIRTLFYKLTGGIIVSIIFIVVAVYLISIKEVSGISTVDGVESATTFSTLIPALVLLVLSISIPLYTIIWYKMFSFIVADNSITINSGVIFRQSKVINYNKIQNVNNVRGPLQMLFGITQIDFWTASPGQVTASTVSFGDNQTRTTIEPKPEGQLLLMKVDAEELKNSISQKGDVQKVQVV